MKPYTLAEVSLVVFLRVSDGGDVCKQPIIACYVALAREFEGFDYSCSMLAKGSIKSH